MSKRKKVLFINFGGIGDEILFLPTILSFKKQYPECEEFARENPTELYLIMKRFTDMKVIIGHREIDGVRTAIYGNRYTKEQCGAILNAYCIDKKLFPLALQMCDDNAFLTEDMVKRAKTDKRYARKLLRSTNGLYS